MCSKGFISYLFNVSESFFQGRKMCGYNDVGDGLWFIPQHEVEWGFASGGVGMTIVDKFRHGNMFNPYFRVGTAKDVSIS